MTKPKKTAEQGDDLPTILRRSILAIVNDEKADMLAKLKAIELGVKLAAIAARGKDDDAKGFFD